MLYCPTVEETMQMFLSLLPRGKAWVAPDDTVMQAFWEGVAQTWTELIEDNICSAYEELFASSTSDNIDLWLEEYGMADGTDPFGSNLQAKVKATGGTQIDYYEGLALDLGWVTEMRWLKRNDDQFPGFYSTLYIEVDLSASPAADDAIHLGGGWVIGLTPLGTPDVDELVLALDEIIPAHCQILAVTTGVLPSPVLDDDSEEFLVLW
ncbi:MAG: hypothetical protein L0287_13460 [Anaerolineae bacterium]|nr:hypothetical protein [Anaerolineae bacterium]